MMNSNIRTAIIVGGSRGIGFAIAEKFLKNSFNVTLVSRNRENLKKAIEKLKVLATNQVIDSRICDISSETDIIETCRSLMDRSSIDVLVNSAGITHNRLLLATKSDDIRRILDINLTGTILFSKLLSRQMIRQKSGHIINIGSVVGSCGNTGQSVYAASKSALVGFTKSLAKELGPKNITVNLIVPGFIETDMTRDIVEHQQDYWNRLIPLQRIGKSEEVANLAYFLAGHRSSSSYITGAVIRIDGGLGLGF